MDIKLTHEDEVVVVGLTGDLNGAATHDTQEAVAPVLKPGARVLIDMTHLAYLSSAGLRTLLILFREGEEKGARVVLFGLSDEVRETMTLTGFLKFFPVGYTRGAALELLKAPTPPAPAA